MSDQHTTNAQLLAELANLRQQAIRLKAKQVRLNERLHDSEERYRSVADFTYDWEYWLGADGQFRYVSPSCERVTGYPAQAFMDNPALLDEIIHPDDQTLWAKHVHNIEGGEIEPIDLRILHRNGQERWISHVCRPVFSETGQPLGQRASNRDIPLRKRAEAEIRLRTAALEAAANGIVITDRDGQILWVNPAMSRLTGYSLEEFIHQNPRLLKSGIHDRDFYKNLWNTVLAGEVWHGEVINRRKDGSLYTEEQMITPVRTTGGEITHFIAIKQDVTERKRAEEAERRQRQLAEALRDTAAALNSTLDFEAVLDRILDHVGRIVQHDAANIMLIDAEGYAQFHRGHGYRELSVNKRFESLRVKVAEVANLQHIVDTGQALVISDTRTDPGWIELPASRWIRSYVSAPIQVKGRVIGFMNLESTTPNFFQPIHAEGLKALTDQAAVAIENARLYDAIRHHAEELEQQIAERKRAEEALRRSNLELQNRNEDLDAFAHTVAHDLKSPVSLVIGYSDELASETDMVTEEEQRQGLAAIARAGHKMNSIINELLLLAEIRTSEVAGQPLDMSSLVKEALQRLAEISIDQHAQIVLPETWPVALGYGPWIEEVWVNYLSNALKYGGAPSAPPRIELGAEAQSDGMVRFWIRDHGPGIPAESQARLFTQFTRLDQVRAKGHGLGLSIVRRIVEKLGGQVGVISQVGKGSTFFFALPRANIEHESEAAK